jgi:hypothetical protein
MVNSPDLEKSGRRIAKTVDGTPLNLISSRGDEFHVVDGYLDINPSESNLPALLEVIHFMMKTNIRREDFESMNAYCVHRLSRMYLELAYDKRITMISQEDIEVFASIPPNEYNSDLLAILRHFHRKVRSDGGSIIIADHIAKSITDVMRS